MAPRGVFIHTATPFDVGEKVLLRFQLPGETIWITAVGQVTWRNADVQKSKQADLGMALQLIEAPQEYLEAIGKRLTRSISEVIRETTEAL